MKRRCFADENMPVKWRSAPRMATSTPTTDPVSANLLANNYDKYSDYLNLNKLIDNLTLPELCYSWGGRDYHQQPLLLPTTLLAKTAPKLTMNICIRKFQHYNLLH